MITRLLIVFAVFVSIGSANASEKARTVDWETLIPASTPLKNPLAHLKMDRQVEIEVLANIRRAQQQGLITEVDYRYEEGIEIAHKLKTMGLDVDDLVAKYETLRQEIERRNADVVDELDGTLIRMPGYALPFEFNETAITEFLLVPYVGACIHVPPPPANQTVFVQLSQSYKTKSLYEPVWVTGRVKVKRTNRSLSFVDGNAPIEAGYTLEDVSIEPYKQ
ncbi:MAG: DUF3299 domain-containing protein [Alphaproteobacteria bacterium]|nr:DUF3299 domain-containing protein [Alphaproteobacteria bacterium]